MQQLQVTPIGEISIQGEEMFIKLKSKYAEALQGMDGFSHINVLWWFSDCDNESSRNVLSLSQPYKKGPAVMGMFALRQPQRPNPIALSTAQIVHIDVENGIIQITYIDAKDGSPVIDLKPYTPSLDWVANPIIPEWCQHWPKSFEESLAYDWKNEFNF